MSDDNGRDRVALTGLAIGILAIVTAGILAFGAESIGSVIRRREALNQPSDATCTQSQECDGKSLKANVRAADAAEHTFDLGVWQMALGIVGIYFVARTLKATRDAVGEAREATAIARRALEGIERPFLVLEFEKTPDHDEYIKEGLDLGPIRFRFVNYGKTPALITYLRREAIPWKFSEPLPDAPKPGTGKGFPLPHGIVVGADKPSRTFDLLPLDGSGFNLPADFPQHDAHRSWFLLGYVRYRDLMGNEYIGGFCFHRLRLEYGFDLATPAVGHGPYNYDRRAKPHEREPLGTLARVYGEVEA